MPSDSNMKAIVMFDTLYGNTEKIASSLAKGLRGTGVETSVVNIKTVNVDELAKYDLLALGAPTQYFTASKSLKEFLKQLEEKDLRGKHGFAFDTKLESRLSGSASKFIEKKLQDLGLQIIRSRASAIVYVQKKKNGKEKSKQTKDNAVAEEITLLRGEMESLFESVGKELAMILKERTNTAATSAGTRAA